ncbi:hypothetical protein DFQ26_001267 [Actinomortierella ambigua]|nr:hypothetical protein DFQ26_001267 [Actinomortierella ambigua]
MRTPIGAGAYGSVYHAYWQGRKVAIKQFTMTLTDVARERAIQQEVRLLDSLRDKHIIQFYGTTEHEGRLVLVMEYAEGGSLEGVIQDGLLDWPAKTRIAQEVVRGLAYIHHMGVLHRDLKSMNVLLTRHMEVKLCDFGLATVKVRSASKSTSSAKGTTRWMAPELFTARPKYSTKSDMFALAVVMWEMAANCTIPFQEQIDNYTVISLIKNGEREELPDDTPLSYRQWVERCWDQDPTKRPEASEMVTKDPEPPIRKNVLGEHKSIVQVTATMSGIALVSPLPGENTSDDGSQAMVRRPAEHVDALLARANAGDADAQWALAAKYDTGLGVGQNDTEAFKWYLRAAAQGSKEAQYATGDFFRRGRGTPKNEAIAAYWMEQAATSGHAIAQNEYGWMYHAGIGIEQDDVKAASWFRQSAKQGCAEAQFNLGCMYQNGYGLPQDYREAWTWFHKAAVQESAAAQNSLGRMYENGLGVERDLGLASSWYRKSANNGNASALSSLESMGENDEDIDIIF